jgi:hypothetical protein
VGRELHALFRERVEMWGADQRMPEAGEAVAAPLIDGDEEDVASRSAHVILLDVVWERSPDRDLLPIDQPVDVMPARLVAIDFETNRDLEIAPTSYRPGRHRDLEIAPAPSFRLL